MKIIPLKYDFCVKEVMDNEIVRKHFISDVLEIPLEDIKSVQVVNPFLRKRYKKEKLGILDIRLTMNDDTKINIEIQLNKQSCWRKRTTYYLAKMYTEDLRRGEAYEKLKKCIAITILDFELDDRTEYHNVYMLRDKQGNIYTDILEMHTIELTKSPNKEQSNPLDEWHSLFNAETEEDLNMIKSRTKNKGIMEAIKELKQISLSDRFRNEYELRLKAKRDREAEDEFVLEQGKKIGREDEREKNIKILINTLREYGHTDEQIVSSLMKKYALSRKEAEEKLR